MLAALAACSSTAAGQPAFEGRHGVGVVQTFMFPASDSRTPGAFADDAYVPRWSSTMPSTRLDELRRAGFDFVRIATDPGPLLDADPARLTQHIGDISAAIRTTIAHGLRVVVDVHPGTDHPRWNFRRLTSGPDDPAFKRLIEVERALGEMLAAFDPHTVALEIFNEPPPPCQWRDRIAWPAQLRTLLAETRRAAPRLTLLVAGACWAAPEGLMLLDPAQFDDNTIFVFHYYEPFVFTHQGYWGSDKYLEFTPPLAFPPDLPQRNATMARVAGRIRASDKIDATSKPGQLHSAARALAAYFDQDQGPAFIARQFTEVARWADRHGVARSRIMLGEFGAMKDIYGKPGAPPDARAAWIRTTRMAAESNGFRWSAWALTNTMGIVTGDLDGPLDPAMVDALGLRTR